MNAAEWIRFLQFEEARLEQSSFENNHWIDDRWITAQLSTNRSFQKELEQISSAEALKESDAVKLNNPTNISEWLKFLKVHEEVWVSGLDLRPPNEWAHRRWATAVLELNRSLQKEAEETIKKAQEPKMDPEVVANLEDKIRRISVAISEIPSGAYAEDFLKELREEYREALKSEKGWIYEWVRTKKGGAK